MYSVEAYALRIGDVIAITVLGSLPNSCYTARIEDWYPGGGIVYVRDPEEAQVFIREEMKPGSDMCLLMLFPWGGHITIKDDYHKTVGIYVNGAKVKDVEIKDQLDRHIVISLTSSLPDKYIGCSVIPEDHPYLSIYSKIFGPATQDDCEQWVSQNCTGVPA